MSRAMFAVLRRTLYVAITALIVWQAMGLLSALRRPPSMAHLKKITVAISGNVDRPGAYRVPAGTTEFEILKVAGVRVTSDLSALSLGEQVAADQNVAVGTLNKPVSMGAFARMEFSLGKLTITTSDGRERPVREGMSVDAGNRIRTAADGQAELSINASTHLDMDRNADVSFDKMAAEDGRPVVELFQRSGLCWYTSAHGGGNEMLRINTLPAKLSLGGKGADATVEATSAQVTVDVREGLVVVERPDAGETVNLMAGQKATAFADGRPLDITKTDRDAPVAERFADLNKTKSGTLAKSMPVNILLCAFPAVLHLVSIRFDRNVVHTVYIPAQVYVGDYVQGFNTIGEAFLYGGSAFVSTIVERILNVRIPKYAVIGKDDIARAVSMLGGVNVVVDDAAARALKASSGRRKLKDQDVISFMKPGLTGSEDAVRRQTEVIRAIFDGFRTKGIVMTALTADQILSGIETNLTAAELMQDYTNFNARAGWSMKSHSLPVKAMTVDGKPYEEPVVEGCRMLLNGE